ncbi:MAG: DNA repair protein RecO [Saprospiraceae bacterium]|nr:DNA repair protein RecO [Saprospiraceae bacterium]
MLQTEGIVFRTTRFRESSLIMDIYTAEKGLQCFIANGVYSKANQRLASLFQLMNVLEMLVYFNEQKEIHRIKEVSPSILYQRIPFDIKRSAIGTFILEVCRKSLSEHQANIELFNFIKKKYYQLDTQDSISPDFAIDFLIEFSGYLGFSPLDNYTETDNSLDLLNGSFMPYSVSNRYAVSPEDSILLLQLIRKKEDEKLFKTLDQRRRILTLLILYYKLHLEHFKDIKSIEVFKGIF